MKKFEVSGHEPSLLPKEYDFKLVWSDEFDGHELDRNKWNFRLRFWGKRFPAYTDEGIVLDGKSNLEIHVVEKNGEFASAQLQTGTNVFDYLSDDRKGGFCGDNAFWPFDEIPTPTFMHRYGYYECRCKLQNAPGWWSAFWLQTPTPGFSGDGDPAYCGIEVDIMENFSRDGLVTSGMFYGNYTGKNRQDARVRYKIEETDDGFHRFGCLWTENGYVFYCDGKETARSKNGVVSKIPQFILLTTECQGYRHTPATATKELREAKLPDCFTVDYVRVFDIL